MTPLPAALAPWRRILSLFPPELAAALGAVVRPIEPLIGPPVAASISQGEPDGLGNLARRGSYERLLASEWLLAEEVPDEFLRRAAAAEHMFLAPAFRRRGTLDSCTVLFDTGPMQLGAPRIAHLAALVLLAQRAEDVRSLFDFGVLQLPDRGLATALTPQTVLDLLAARSIAAVDEACRGAWQTRLATPGACDELWIVGHPDTVALWPEASRIAVDEVVEPGRRAVHVGVRHGRRAPLERTIALPEVETCVRLLRRPFEPEPGRLAGTLAGTVVLAADSPLRLSGDGKALMARLGDGRLVALMLDDRAERKPQKLWATAPSVLEPPPYTQLVAATFQRKAWRAVWIDEGSLVSSSWQEDVNLRFGSPPTELEVSDQGTVIPGRAWFDHKRQVCLLADAAHKLFELGPGPSVHWLGTVLADAPSGRGLLAVYRDRKGMAYAAAFGHTVRVPAAPGIAYGEVVLGNMGPTTTPPHLGFVRKEPSGQVWAILVHPKLPVTLPTDAVVLAALEQPMTARYQPRPGPAPLMYLDPDRRSLMIGRNDHGLTVLSTVVRIDTELGRVRSAWASPRLGKVVLATDTGSVFVFDLRTNRLMPLEGVSVAA